MIYLLVLIILVHLTIGLMVERTMVPELRFIYLEEKSFKWRALRYISRFKVIIKWPKYYMIWRNK